MHVLQSWDPIKNKTGWCHICLVQHYHDQAGIVTKKLIWFQVYFLFCFAFLILLDLEKRKINLSCGSSVCSLSLLNLHFKSKNQIF